MLLLFFSVSFSEGYRSFLREFNFLKSDVEIRWICTRHLKTFLITMNIRNTFGCPFTETIVIFHVFNLIVVTTLYSIYKFHLDIIY